MYYTDNNFPTSSLAITLLQVDHFHYFAKFSDEVPAIEFAFVQSTKVANDLNGFGPQK